MSFEWRELVKHMLDGAECFERPVSRHTTRRVGVRFGSPR